MAQVSVGEAPPRIVFDLREERGNPVGLFLAHVEWVATFASAISGVQRSLGGLEELDIFGEGGLGGANWPTENLCRLDRGEEQAIKFWRAFFKSVVESFKGWGHD